MAKKPTKYVGFVLFDVFYEDGSQRSNRKVPADMLGGLDGDEPARQVIAEQDREIPTLGFSMRRALGKNLTQLIQRAGEGGNGCGMEVDRHDERLGGQGDAVYG